MPPSNIFNSSTWICPIFLLILASISLSRVFFVTYNFYILIRSWMKAIRWRDRINQLVNRSVNSLNQHLNQPINQSIDRSTNTSTSQHNKPINLVTNQLINHTIQLLNWSINQQPKKANQKNYHLWSSSPFVCEYEQHDTPDKDWYPDVPVGEGPPVIGLFFRLGQGFKLHLQQQVVNRICSFWQKQSKESISDYNSFWHEQIRK